MRICVVHPVGALLLTSILTAVLKVQPVIASGTVYIRSVRPPNQGEEAVAD